MIPGSVTNIAKGAFWSCTNAANVTIPGSVLSVGTSAFQGCTSLSSVTIPNSVTNLGDWAFYDCTSLTNVTIGNGVTRIGAMEFTACAGLGGVTIPSSITSIGEMAFAFGSSLSSVYFEGNAPAIDPSAFSGDNNTTVYYLPGTTGWGPTFGGCPTRLWENAPPPSIVTPPLAQTAEMGALAGFWVEVTNTPPAAAYQWYFNGANAVGGTTNRYLDLANVQPGQAGAYTVVVTDVYAAVTSAPALLSGIAPVERRTVAALNSTADLGSFLQLE